VQGDGEGFGHGGVGERDAVGQAIEDAGWNRDILGKSTVLAVFGAGDAEDAAVGAEIDEVGGAEGAIAARYCGIEGCAIADSPAGDIGAEAGDSTGGFVAHDDRGESPAGGAVCTVDVRAANAAGTDTYEHLARAWGGVGDVGVVEAAGGFEDEGFHMDSLLIGRFGGHCNALKRL